MAMQFQNNLILPNSIDQLKSLKNICRSRNDLVGQQKSCRVRPSLEQIAQVISRSFDTFAYYPLLTLGTVYCLRLGNKMS